MRELERHEVARDRHLAQGVEVHAAPGSLRHWRRGSLIVADPDGLRALACAARVPSAATSRKR